MAGNEPKKRMRGQHQSSSSPSATWALRAGLRRSIRCGRGVTPHVAQNTYDTGRARQTSAIDGRTTRHPGYAASQRVRKRIEEVFGWVKASAGLRKTKFRSQNRGAIPVHPRLLLASSSSEYPSCSRRPGHDMHFSRGDHTRWRSVASLLESYGAITGGETREEAVTQQSSINRQGDAIGDMSVRRNRGAVGFDLWQIHRENAVDMSAPAESCGPFGRGRGATL